MLRISLLLLTALLFALMSPIAMAHEGSVAAPDGSDCADSNAPRDGESASATDRAAPARGDRKLTPDIHGDLPASRSQSTRWHSFLPGMFR